MRCSTHSLEIQRGRHENKHRSDRLCRICNSEKVETEEHFLLYCPAYQLIRRKYDLIRYTDALNLTKEIPNKTLGRFIICALNFRKAQT